MLVFILGNLLKNELSLIFYKVPLIFFSKKIVHISEVFFLLLCFSLSQNKQILMFCSISKFFINRKSKCQILIAKLMKNLLQNKNKFNVITKFNVIIIIIIIHHHHHQITLTARISLTLSCYPSLSSIALNLLGCTLNASKARKSIREHHFEIRPCYFSKSPRLVRLIWMVWAPRVE